MLQEFIQEVSATRSKQMTKSFLTNPYQDGDVISATFIKMGKIFWTKDPVQSVKVQDLIVCNLGFMVSNVSFYSLK